MGIKQSLNIAAKIMRFRLARLGVCKPGKPINFTFSITNKCQSRCRSCNIWDLYRQYPEKLEGELSLAEIERMFRSVGEIYFFNVSGGCPFLRRDFPEIVELACKYLKPSVIHIPTNALAVEKALSDTEKILEIMKANLPHTVLQIKPSFDGVGEMHDAVRGVPGNFAKLLRLVQGLKELQKKYGKLRLGLGTVVSRFNVKDIKEIIGYADRLEVGSYISEIAENRDEMFNLDDPIAPAPADYRAAMGEFKKYVASKLEFKKGLTRLTDAFRLVYYDLAVEIVEQKRQVIPCYGGITNVHVDPYGNVWPCCILGNTQSMGNMKDDEFRFWKIWNSSRAETARSFIKAGKCQCPLANQSYANILCSPRKMVRVLSYLSPFKAPRWRGTS